MLKIEVSDGNGHVEATGDLKSVVTDLGLVVHRMYNLLYTSNPLAALAFKMTVQGVITDPASGIFTRSDIGGTAIVAVVPAKGEQKDG